MERYGKKNFTAREIWEALEPLAEDPSHISGSARRLYGFNYINKRKMKDNKGVNIYSLSKLGRQRAKYLYTNSHKIPHIDTSFLLYLDVKEKHTD